MDHLNYATDNSGAKLRAVHPHAILGCVWNLLRIRKKKDNAWDSVGVAIEGTRHWRSSFSRVPCRRWLPDVCSSRCIQRDCSAFLAQSWSGTKNQEKQLLYSIFHHTRIHTVKTYAHKRQAHPPPLMTMLTRKQKGHERPLINPRYPKPTPLEEADAHDNNGSRCTYATATQGTVVARLRKQHIISAKNKTTAAAACTMVFISLKSRSNSVLVCMRLYICHPCPQHRHCKVWERSVVCKLSICRRKGYVQDQRILLHMMMGHRPHKVCVKLQLCCWIGLSDTGNMPCHLGNCFMQGIDFWWFNKAGMHESF